MCFSFYQSLLCNAIHHRVGVLYPEGIRVGKGLSTRSVEVWEVQNITNYIIFRKPNSKVQVSFSDQLWYVVCKAVRPQSINFLVFRYVISYLIFRTNGKWTNETLHRLQVKVFKVFSRISWLILSNFFKHENTILPRWPNPTLYGLTAQWD